jgi:hypothetical protein
MTHLRAPSCTTSRAFRSAGRRPPNAGLDAEPAAGFTSDSLARGHRKPAALRQECDGFLPW